MRAMHKSSYLTYILLQTAGFATEGIENVMRKKEGERGSRSIQQKVVV